MNRRLAIVVAGAVVAVVLANHFYTRSGASSDGSVGEWYALNSPYGNCARLYGQHSILTLLHDYELVICHQTGRRYTCWERPFGLQTLEAGFHKVDLQHRRFDADCKTALRRLRSAGLRP